MSAFARHATRIVAHMIAVIASAWIVGCADRGPTQPPPSGPGLSDVAIVVSNPIAGPVANSIAGQASLAAPGVTLAYVSLSPGSVPAGLAASIRNRSGGPTVRAVLLDGGFDPVAVPAAVGDTLEYEIHGAGGIAAVARGTKVVRAPRRPVVVRISPASGKRDVPLNSVISVVFSEPMDASTITTASVQLLRNGQPVPGLLALGYPDVVMVSFTPEEPLAGGARYDIIVSREVHDRDGEPLEATVTSMFTTAVQHAELPLLLSTVGAAILQNDPSLGCPHHAARGFGFRLAFAWSPGPAGEAVVSSRLYVKHPGAQFAAIDAVLQDSTFDVVACNAFVIDRNLYGWEWQVRFEYADGSWGEWSEPGIFDFLPCRLGDGRPCNAPPE